MSFPHPLHVTAMAAVLDHDERSVRRIETDCGIRAPHGVYFLNNRGRSTTETLSHMCNLYSITTYSLIRCFSIALQAASASSKDVKGEPMILIAPRPW
jgi:hypothetical protein